MLFIINLLTKYKYNGNIKILIIIKITNPGDESKHE